MVSGLSALTASKWVDVMNKRNVVVVAAGALLVIASLFGVGMLRSTDSDPTGEALPSTTLVDRGAVPDVVGLTRAKAESVLADAGFGAALYGDVNDVVTEQFPEADSVLLYGRDVVVRFGDILAAPAIPGQTTIPVPPSTELIPGETLIVTDSETGETLIIAVPDPDSPSTPPTTVPLRDGRVTTVPRGGTGGGATVPIETVVVDPDDNDGIDTPNPDQGATVTDVTFEVIWRADPVYETGVYNWVVSYAASGDLQDLIEVATLPVTTAGSGTCETVSADLPSALPASGVATLELQIGGQAGDSIGGHPAGGVIHGSIDKTTSASGPILIFTELGVSGC